jgi:DNA-binding transcriptional LysR family regulator
VTAPDLRELRVFVAVAEEGSFTGAAKRLFVARQAVSATLATLERRLDVNLVVRDGRSLRLLPAGETLLREARAVLARVDAAVERVRRSAAGTKHIAVGYVPPTDRRLLRALARHVDTGEDDAVLELRELAATEIVAGVRDGRLDLGLARFPPPADDLHVEVLSHDEVVIALSRRHRLASREALTLDKLANERLLLRPSSDGYNRFVVALMRSAGIEPVTVYARVYGNPALRLVERGEAFALVERLAPGVGTEDVALVPAGQSATRALPPSPAACGSMTAIPRSETSRGPSSPPYTAPRRPNGRLQATTIARSDAVCLQRWSCRPVALKKITELCSRCPFRSPPRAEAPIRRAWRS